MKKILLLSTFYLTTCLSSFASGEEANISVRVSTPREPSIESSMDKQVLAELKKFADDTNALSTNASQLSTTASQLSAATSQLFAATSQLSVATSKLHRLLTAEIALRAEKVSIVKAMDSSIEDGCDIDYDIHFAREEATLANKKAIFAREEAAKKYREVREVINNCDDAIKNYRRICNDYTAADDDE